MIVGCKPHAVFVPFPLQGHISTMLKFAKLLHHRGFHITFVNSEFNHKGILDCRGPQSLDGLPDFRFETMPIGIPPPSNRTSLAHYMGSLKDSIRKNFVSLFRNLLAKLNNNVNVPPVTCIIADGVLNHAITVAEELGIPTALFWAMGANGFMDYKRFHNLIARCLAPSQDVSDEMNEDLDTIIHWIPGMAGIRLRDLSNLMQTTVSNDYIIDDIVGEAERASKASAIIIHTFETLERAALDAISSMFSRVYSIGPLHLLTNQITDHSLMSIRCDLWKEETTCIQWLNSKEPNSVLYVSFGSTTVFTPEQLVELAWGLANSNHHFLWIIRSDMIMGESAVLPHEFLEAAKQRCLIISWCEQEQVLNHPAIGGFLTHNGWNSTLESICAGIPMIGWPFFGEHLTNCKCCCNEWGIGMEINNEVKRGEVEKLVRELMQGERGKEMKKKAKEWKKFAEESTAPLGLSSEYLNKLVDEVLLQKNPCFGLQLDISNERELP